MESTYAICIVIAAIIGLYDGISKTKSKKYRQSIIKDNKEIFDYFMGIQ